MIDQRHEIMHNVAHFIGHQIGPDIPMWMHPVLHVVLVWAPVAFLVVAVVIAYRIIRATLARHKKQENAPGLGPVPGLDSGIYRFVLRFSRFDQLILMTVGLFALPVLYATLELPKKIINNALSTESIPTEAVDAGLASTSYLFILCALYLISISVNGALKYWINVRKGQVGERVLRRLRLTIYRQWRRGDGPERRSEVIPLIAQEVEPVGGFAADAFALPVFQGGTFLTILVFMFVQDPVLGAAAITLLPVQLAIIPRLQKRVNELARRRVAEVRALGGGLGDEITARSQTGKQIQEVGSRLRRIEDIRRNLHRSKYLLKSLNNFLTALTPFFFYSIGGYLVIEDRLSLGALVAVLAAYKDFSAPLKELFRYYQTAEDVRVRYGEVLGFLSTQVPSARPPVQGSLMQLHKGVAAMGAPP